MQRPADHFLINNSKCYLSNNIIAFSSFKDEQDLEDPLTPRLPNKDSVVIRKNLSIYEADKRISKLPDMNEESILLSSGNHEQIELEYLNREEPKSPPPPLIEDESEDESKIENL